MAELVYAFDLKSNGEIHMGSSPISGTSYWQITPIVVLFCWFWSLLSDSISRNMVRSGWLRLDHDALRHAGTYSNDWSSVAADYSLPARAHAYDLHFDHLSTYTTSGPDNRYYGLPVRCLVYYFVRNDGTRRLRTTNRCFCFLKIDSMRW